MNLIGRRLAAGAVLVMALVAGLVAPARAVASPAPGDGYLHVSDDFVIPVSAIDQGMASTAADHSLQGFTTFDPELDNIGTYTVRLDTNAEAMRPYVASAVAELNGIAGYHLTLAAGTITTNPAAPNVPEGEIQIALSDTSPCTGGWVGCGGPQGSVSVEGRSYWDSGFVWLKTTVPTFADGTRHSTVDHEIGHTLGLGHFAGTYGNPATTQIMNPTVGSTIVTYKPGDTNGLLFEAPDPPANDDLAAAQPIGPASTTVAAFSNRFATTEANEPTIGGQTANRTRWLSFTAATSGPVSVRTASATAPARLQVFTGSTIAGLQTVGVGATTAGNDAAATFSAVAGTTYRIAVGTAPGSFGTQQVVLSTTDGDYHQLTPARIVDSRTGTGITAGRWPSGTNVAKVVTGVGGVPASGVQAVVLDVTAVSPAGNGWLTVFPHGQALPMASSVNYATGRTVANLVTVKVGAGGAIDITASGGSPDVLVDVIGWFGAPAGARLTTTTPTRVLDSRSGTGLSGAWTAGQTRTLHLTGVPAGAVAVVMNLTATSPAADGWLTAWPHGATMPTASNLSYAPGQTVANLAVIGLSAGGDIDLYSKAAAHVVGDVVGWFASAGSGVTAVAPTRLLDTRTTGGPLGPDGGRSLTVGGVGPVPATATAVLLNVTVTGTTAASWLTMWPAFTTKPATSNLNWAAGQTVPNLVLVPLTAGVVWFSNALGQTDVVVDVVGYAGP